MDITQTMENQMYKNMDNDSVHCPNVDAVCKRES